MWVQFFTWYSLFLALCQTEQSQGRTCVWKLFFLFLIYFIFSHQICYLVKSTSPSLNMYSVNHMILVMFLDIMTMIKVFFDHSSPDLPWAKTYCWIYNVFLFVCWGALSRALLTISSKHLSNNIVKFAFIWDQHVSNEELLSCKKKKKKKKKCITGELYLLREMSRNLLWLLPILTQGP